MVDAGRSFTLESHGPLEIVSRFIVMRGGSPTEDRQRRPTTSGPLLVPLSGTVFDRLEYGIRIERVLLIVFNVTHRRKLKDHEPVFTGGREKAELLAAGCILHRFHDGPRVLAARKNVTLWHFHLCGVAEIAERRAFRKLDAFHVFPIEAC